MGAIFRGGGNFSIFKRKSPKYVKYIWNAAYEIEKEVQLSFSNDKYIWHSADQEQKRQISNGMYL